MEAMPLLLVKFMLGVVIVCAVLVVLCLIADGWGGFRRPIRKAEEEFDRKAVEGTLIPQRRLVDDSDETLEQQFARARADKTLYLYDRQTDSYI